MAERRAGSRPFSGCASPYAVTLPSHHHAGIATASHSDNGSVVHARNVECGRFMRKAGAFARPTTAGCLSQPREAAQQLQRLAHCAVVPLAAETGRRDQREAPLHRDGLRFGVFADAFRTVAASGAGFLEAADRRAVSATSSYASRRVFPDSSWIRSSTSSRRSRSRSWNPARGRRVPGRSMVGFALVLLVTARERVHRTLPPHYPFCILQSAFCIPTS